LWQHAYRDVASDVPNRRKKKVLDQSKLLKYPAGRHSDGNNLYVIITRPGCGSFMYRSNKYQEGLGSIRFVTLAQARERAVAIRKLEHEGKDPRIERVNARLDQEVAKGLAKTFRQVADEFFEMRFARKRPGTIKRYQVMLRKYVFPGIGDMPTGKITQSAILKDHGMGLEDFWPKISCANRIRGLVERILDFAEYRGYPVHLHKGKNAAAWKGSLEYILEPSWELHKVKHRASLPYQDVPRFLSTLWGYKCRSSCPDSNTAMPLLIELFLLTGVRVNEGLLATLGEMDTVRMVWTIPTGPDGHTKRKDEREKPREIPITTAMLDLLKRAKKKRIEMGVDSSNPDAPVFPGKWGRPHRANSCIVFLDRTLNWTPKITTHGLRSTLRDWCRANGYPNEWWEIQAHHVLGDKTSQAYGHDPLFEQRRGMMEAWGNFCTRPTPATGTNVAQINEARKRRMAS
jgi:integrase